MANISADSMAASRSFPTFRRPRERGGQNSRRVPVSVAQRWGNSNGIHLELERRYSKGIAFQVFYVLDNNFMAGGNGYQTTSMIPEVNQFLPGAVPATRLRNVLGSLI